MYRKLLEILHLFFFLHSTRHITNRTNIGGIEFGAAGLLAKKKEIRIGQTLDDGQGRFDSQQDRQ